jgi:hypothetical protein
MTSAKDLLSKLENWSFAGQLEISPVLSSPAYDDPDHCPGCPSCTFETTVYIGYDQEWRHDKWECGLCGHVFPVAVI